ncbi:MAG: hypothetical protein JSV88_27040, partial [Candidatus Aminicenantes bacterium]
KRGDRQKSGKKYDATSRKIKLIDPERWLCFLPVTFFLSRFLLVIDDWSDWRINYLVTTARKTHALIRFVNRY